MKIGIDARIWSETTGRYVRNLVKELSKLDLKNEYFIFVKKEEENKIKSEINNNQFKIIPTQIVWHTLNEQLKFAKELNAHNLDLMHFTYFSIPIRYSKPFVVTIHDLIIHHFPTGKASTLPPVLYYIKRLAYMFIIKQAADKSKKIIAVSNATKAEVIDHLNVFEKKIEVIYEGIDEKILTSKTKKIYDFPYILYVGNAYPHKNLNRTVTAFGLSQRHGEKLVLVGKENYFYKRLKNYVTENNIKDVIFFGEASDEELASLYSNAKAYIMPSLMEGFGLPPLEALGSGCFVIASDIPALKEICQDAALYFDPYDTKDIGEKIQFAFSDKSKEDYIKSGLNRVKFFSWSKMAKETLKLYESSIGI